jgi:hypothetical protein
MSSKTTAAKAEPPEVAAPAPIEQAVVKPSVLHVLDTTATHDGPPREHAMTLEGGITRNYRFTAGKPTELPWEIALKFLKHDAFRLTDADGNLIPWRGTPRQPEDLAAGERFHLADDEVVARYDELTTQALQMRCAQMPSGESIARARDRDAMIAFIVERTMKRRLENSMQENTDPDSFMPPPESDDEGNFFGDEV